MIKQVSLKDKRTENLVLFGVLILAFAAHALNAFNFPYFENDEGTYMSQAWSVLRFNELAPYQYNFDHAPLGWLFISLWVLLTGGFFTFGFSLHTGRVFMIVLHILSAFLLYKFGKNLTGSKLVSLFSVLLFSLSPLAIYFQRRILIDNIMVFWLILSLYLATRNKRTEIELILSAVAYSVAILTKETALVFLPGFLYLIYQKAHDYSNSLATGKKSIEMGVKQAIKWLVVSFVVTLIYPLLAYLNGQLFPFQGGINLVDAIKMQLSRVEQESNSLLTTADLWFKDDPIFLLFGAVSTFILVILAFSNRTARILIVFIVSYILFLARGGIVFEFYILPLLPFFALSISYLAGLLHKRISNVYLRKTPYTILGISVIVMFLLFSKNVKEGFNLFTSNQTLPQKEAVTWLLENTPSGSNTVIDNYAYVDLNDRKPSQDTRYDYYWKVGTDPEVRNSVYGNNSSNIDRLVLTPQMQRDITDFGSLDIVQRVANNSSVLKRFEKDGYRVDILDSSL